MCIEIFATGKINVRRSNEEIKELLLIRNGKYEFEKLIEEANKKIKLIDELSAKTSFPDKLETIFINSFLKNLRKEFYKI